MMQKIITCLIFSLASQAILIAQETAGLPLFQIGAKNAATTSTLQLTGKVLDADTEEAVVGAVVQILDTNINVVTDAAGQYTLNLPQGKYVLNISFLGYETYAARLHVFESGTQDFQIVEAALDLEQVTVTQKRQNDNITSVVGSVEQMNIEEVQQKSQFLGEVDVLRSLQSLSGVSSAGEGASGFNVRGGNTDENLILQDGNLIINPVHALGFFSLFHPDLVNDITLYKGDVPAKYGGRLSSMLDIKLREGSTERFAGQGGLGIASSRLALEGPLVKNKASFIIGGRASYFDWILGRVNNIDLRKSKAFFYDLTAKVDARLTPTTKVGATLFNAADDFQFADDVKFDYETRTGSVYLKQVIGEKMNLNALVNMGQYHSTLFDIEGNNQSRFDNEIRYLRASLGLFYQVSEAYTLEVGAEQNRYEVEPGALEPIGEESFIEAASLDEEQGQETAVYLQNQLKIGKNLELIAGLRYTLYQSLGASNISLYAAGEPKTIASIQGELSFADGEEIVRYTGIEPRISLRYTLSEASSLKLGYSRAFQFFSQISNTASATPIDIWQLSNYHIEPQRADNFSIGYFQNFKDNGIQTQLSLFYRDIQQLIDYRDFAQLLLNDHIETDLVTGKGRAYGLELSLNKNYGKHRINGNYTYSRSLRQVVPTDTQVGVNEGAWYPSNFDKPHILNLNYVFQPHPKNSFSFNFTYSTGRPTTAPVSSYTNDNLLGIPIYSERNEFRIPDFHRLDFAYTIGPWGQNGYRENSLTLSIYNLYARKNAFSVFFRQKPFESIKAYRVAVLGTIFPAVTYNFKF